MLIPAGLIILSIGSSYVFIPGELNVGAARVAQCNLSGAFRSVADGRSLEKWWPAGGIGGYSCRMEGSVYPQVGLVLEKEGQFFHGMLSVLSAGLSDSISLIWQCRISCSSLPWRRWQQYREAVRLREVMQAGVDSLKSFLGKMENVYGTDIRNVMLLDSTLVQTTKMMSRYPVPADIYPSIHSMRAYIAGQGAKEIDFPMLHVERRSDSVYECTIAIPVDRELRGTKEFVPVRFVPWKVLRGEVRGGTVTAAQAMVQLQYYAADHQLTMMAMPFQSLVTERDQEPDTTRWVTRVVVPVP